MVSGCARTRMPLQHDQGIERHAAVRQREERIDVDRLDDAVEVGGEPPSATSASTTASTSRPRAAIALQQLGAAHAREHVARLVRLTGGAQNVTSLTSSSKTPPLPAITTTPISGSR